MKYLTLICAVVLMSLTACYKDNPYWLDENIKEGGTYYPLIQEFTATPIDGDKFVEGAKVNLSVVFWSRDDIKGLEFYEVDDIAENLIKVVDYNAEFDEEMEAWRQSIEYTIPNGTADSTITLKAEVITVYDLTRESLISIDVE